MVVFIFIYFISVIAGFSPFYKNMAEKNALLNAHTDAHATDALIAERYQDLYDLEEKIKDALEENPSHDTISQVFAP